MENVIDLIARKFKNLIGNDHSSFCGKETAVGHLARTPLLFLLFMLCCMMASAQQVEVTLTEAGTLPEKIASDQKYNITSLKVSGPINGTDVRYLYEMAGQYTDGKLVELNLTDANIVEGGDYYYDNHYGKYYYTTNDAIGDYIFLGCRNLESIKLPNSVTNIGDYAFSGCSSLTSVNIPDSVTSIGDYAFNGCSSLTSVTIGNSVTSIGYRAFYDCSSLTSVNIGNSVASIGNYAFWFCSSLTSVNIPNSVTSIANWAFSRCYSLTSVTIGNSVTSIGDGAFDGCIALVKLITLCATPPTCGVNPFNGINKQKCTLYVPKNSLEAYKAAYGWKDFYNMEEGDPTGISLPSSDGTDKVARRYDTNGHLMPTTFKGLNILKMGDGTTKKVWVK